LIQIEEAPEEIKTSFKIAQQKKEIIEEFVTLEQPTETTIKLEKPKEKEEKPVQESHEEIKITKKKKSIPEVKKEEVQEVSNNILFGF
jgi:hypothetical protein